MRRAGPDIPIGVYEPVVGLGTAEERLEMVVDLVRRMSNLTDPQEMVAVFRARATELYGGDGSVSLSRRDLNPPSYRITRSTTWHDNINPWKEKHRLPLLKGGLLGDLLYSDRPQLLHGVEISSQDPAFEHIGAARAIAALPLYDGGEAINMVVRYSHDPDGFRHLRLPEAVLDANLFGRASKGLLLATELQAAYGALDRELRHVAQIQRSLLPARLPEIPGVDMAVSYRTAARAGGDYYDIFRLDDTRWGFLIADASGHGTPAAVQMAILRTIMHAHSREYEDPARLLCYANRHLCDQAEINGGFFITAFYGVLNTKCGTLHYACAGHNPPFRIDRSGRAAELDEAQALPLAVSNETEYIEATAKLASGDTLLLYTDGITEAMNESGEMYGRDRLLSCVHEKVPNAQHIIDCVVHKLLGFTGETTVLQDDRTLLALRLK